MTLPTTLEKSIIITKQLIEDYATISGDANPVHFDKHIAKQNGYPDRIAHGMLLVSLHASLCSPFLDQGWNISEMTTKFIRPVLLGETVYFSMKTIKVTNQKITTRILCTNHDNKTIFYGKIIYMNFK